MTNKELIETLREEGFSASDVISIIAFFITDVSVIQKPVLKQHAKGIRMALEAVKEEEARMMEDLFT